MLVFIVKSSLNSCYLAGIYCYYYPHINNITVQCCGNFIFNSIYVKKMV